MNFNFDEKKAFTVDAYNYTTESLSDIIRLCDRVSSEKDDEVKRLMVMLKQHEKEVGQNQLQPYYLEAAHLSEESTLYKLISQLAEELQELKEKNND